MDLNINFPAYFTRQYGTDGRVYDYCRRCREYFKDKSYGGKLKIIGIVPRAAPSEEYNRGKWPEKVKIISGGECAAAEVRIDFTRYFQADSRGKIALVREAVKRAAKMIGSRVKFDRQAFCRDLDNVL